MDEFQFRKNSSTDKPTQLKSFKALQPLYMYSKLKVFCVSEKLSIFLDFDGHSFHPLQMMLNLNTLVAFLLSTQLKPLNHLLLCRYQLSYCPYKSIQYKIEESLKDFIYFVYIYTICKQKCLSKFVMKSLKIGRISSLI